MSPAMTASELLPTHTSPQVCSSQACISSPTSFHPQSQSQIKGRLARAHSIKALRQSGADLDIPNTGGQSFLYISNGTRVDVRKMAASKLPSAVRSNTLPVNQAIDEYGQEPKTSNVPPTKADLEKAGNVPIYDGQGKKTMFRNLYQTESGKSRKVLLLFIRHFLCGVSICMPDHCWEY